MQGDLNNIYFQNQYRVSEEISTLLFVGSLAYTFCTPIRFNLFSFEFKKAFFFGLRFSIWGSAGYLYRLVVLLFNTTADMIDFSTACSAHAG